MNKKELDILLEKYYRGETSLAEEGQLQEALCDDNVDALLMDGLASIANEDVEIPTELERILSDNIDEWEAAERRVQAVAPSRSKNPIWWAVAASFVVVVAIGGWRVSKYSETTVQQNNPIIAKVPEPVVQNSVPQEKDITKQSDNPQAKEQVKPRMRRETKRVEIRRVTQVASHECVNPNLTDDEQEMALAALEKFSAVLDKGANRLNEAGGKMEEFNNTIKQYFYIY